MYEVEIFQDKRKGFRARVRSSNSLVVLPSESHKNLKDVKELVKNLREGLATANVFLIIDEERILLTEFE